MMTDCTIVHHAFILQSTKKYQTTLKKMWSLNIFRFRWVYFVLFNLEGSYGRVLGAIECSATHLRYNTISVNYFFFQIQLLADIFRTFVAEMYKTHFPYIWIYYSARQLPFTVHVFCCSSHPMSFPFIFSLCVWHILLLVSCSNTEHLLAIQTHSQKENVGQFQTA